MVTYTDTDTDTNDLSLSEMCVLMTAYSVCHRILSWSRACVRLTVRKLLLSQIYGTSPVASGRQEKSSDPKKTPEAYEVDEEEEDENEPHIPIEPRSVCGQIALCYMKLYLCFVLLKVNITYVLKVGLVLRATFIKMRILTMTVATLAANVD